LEFISIPSIAFLLVIVKKPKSKNQKSKSKVKIKSSLFVNAKTTQSCLVLVVVFAQNLEANEKELDIFRSRRVCFSEEREAEVGRIGENHFKRLSYYWIDLTGSNGDL
jgi:hypothetical protein